MKIAIAGKGGTGKTLIAGTLARLFAQDGYKVLAIDNDSSMNLSYSIGIDEYIRQKIVPIKEMLDLIEQRTGQRPGTASGGIYNINPKVSDIPDKYKIYGPDGVQLLVVGSIEEPATGCLCPENVLIRTLLYNLFVQRDEAIIVDFEAGLEHLGRGTGKGIEIMLIATEPSIKSIELTKHILKLSKGLGVKNNLIVLNKIKDEAELEIINKKLKEIGLNSFHVIPFDPEIGKADLEGVAPLDFNPNSKAVQSIRDLFGKLKEFKQN